MHVRVQGTAPDGRRYSANDPHLLTFVHHTLVDSFLRSYRRYGAGPIGTVDADRYVAEMAVLADEFGAEPAARSVAELRAWFRAEKPQLRAGRQARDAVRFLPPAPAADQRLTAKDRSGVGKPPARWPRPASLRQPPTPVVPGHPP